MIIHPKCLAHSGCLAFSINACMHAKSLQSCLILCDPIVCSPPGSSVHGILQARILESVAMPSSRGSSQPRSHALQADSLHSESPGKSFFSFNGELRNLKVSLAGGPSGGGE